MAKQRPNNSRPTTKTESPTPTRGTQKNNGGRGDNKKGKGKGKPTEPKERGKYSEPKEKDTGYSPAPGSNNPAWHSPDAKILEQSCSLSWSYQTGESIETSRVTGVGSSRAVLPGFMVVREKISCGSLQYQSPTARVLDYAQPASVAANTLLTEMRSRARLRNTYDAPDVAMLMLAMANLYGAIFLAKRLANTAKTFSYQNEYLPRNLFYAQGFNYSWFRSHLYDFVSELNVIISEVNKVYIPARMHLFNLFNERWSNYYTEGESIRDQIYFFTPAMLCALDYTPSTDYSSSLVPVMVLPGKWATVTDLRTAQYDASSLYTGDDLLTVIKHMLSMVVNEGSTPDITGDMMNCFGEGDSFQMPFCDLSIPSIPVFNEEILEVIHNAKLSHAVFSNYYKYDGTNVSNIFRTMQLVTSNEIGDWNIFPIQSSELPYAAYENNFQIIDVHRDPNPYKVMEITRCRNDVIAYGTENGISYVAVEMGAELICSLDYYTLNSSTGVYVKQILMNWIEHNNTYWYSYVCVKSPFHYSHLMLPINDSTGVAISDVWYIGETDIFTELPEKYQKNMNRISLMTLLGAYNNA